MKKNKKIIVSLVITLLTATMLLAGCSKEKATVEESAKIISALYINQDTSNIDKVGFSKADGAKILDNEKKAENKAMKASLSVSSLKFTDEDIQKICDAEMNLRKKVKIVSAEKVSGDKKSAKIKIKTQYIDYSTLSNKVANDVIAKVQTMEGTTTEKLDKASKLFVTQLIDAMGKASVSTDTKEETFTFIFKDKDKVWFPENDDTFEEGLGKLVMGE